MQNKAKKGVYILIISVNKQISIKVGKLGKLQLQPETHMYVGSALGSGSTSLQHRINRHILKTDQRKNHWHIDYITSLPQKYAKIHFVVSIETSKQLECMFSQKIAQIDGIRCPIPKFGASDCSQCESHLYSYSKPVEQAVEECKKIAKKLGVIPKVFSANVIDSYEWI